MKSGFFPAAMLAMAMCGPAWGQGFPDRPLRLVTILAPGSTTDFHARATAAKLGAQLGQSIVVESNAGSGGLLAMRAVYRTQPLGYTLLYGTNALVANLYTYKDPGYKLDDYAVVAPIGMTPYGLLVHTSVPVSNIRELVAYAKANPGKLNYVDNGPTTSTILLERLKAEAGLDMVPIPYKGGTGVLQALLTGEVHMNIVSVGAMQERIATGKVRGMAVSSEQRSVAQPDLPTFKESGFKNMNMIGWHALFVPSAAPRAAIQKLQEGMARVNASPEMKDQMAKVNYEFWPGTLEQFSAYIRAESVATAEDFKRLKLPVKE